MNAKLTAFNINSTHIKITIGFLRIMTPMTPIVKRMADSAASAAA